MTLRISLCLLWDKPRPTWAWACTCFSRSSYIQYYPDPIIRSSQCVKIQWRIDEPKHPGKHTSHLLWLQPQSISNWTTRPKTNRKLWWLTSRAEGENLAVWSLTASGGGPGRFLQPSSLRSPVFLVSPKMIFNVSRMQAVYHNFRGKAKRCKKHNYNRRTCHDLTYLRSVSHLIIWYSTHFLRSCQWHQRGIFILWG